MYVVFMKRKFFDTFLHNLMLFFSFCLLEIAKLKPQEKLACQKM